LIKRSELIEIAHLCRIQTGEPNRLWPPAEHYFDRLDNQIAMVYNPKTDKEHIIVFDPPRTWPEEYKRMYAKTYLRNRRGDQE
jgi:hypothetical protein